MPGVFVYDYDYNGKPYYFNDNQQLHMYYESATCNAWIVGPTLGEHNGIVYAKDQGSNPVIASDWQGNNVVGQWITLIDFSFRCTDDAVPIGSLLTGTTAAPSDPER